MPPPSPWATMQGIDRLGYLPDEPPVPAPEGFEVGPDAPVAQYLQQLRAYAQHKIEPELLDDREDLYEREWEDLEDTPTWWTLQPEDKLECWAQLLEEDLQCDRKSCCAFVSLANQGHRGFMEALRILVHLTKDKDSGKGPRRSDHSSWLMTACTEAMESLKNEEAWQQGPAASEGPAKGGSSSSNPAWPSYQAAFMGKGQGTWQGPVGQGQRQAHWLQVNLKDLEVTRT